MDTGEPVQEKEVHFALNADWGDVYIRYVGDYGKGTPGLKIFGNVRGTPEWAGVRKWAASVDAHLREHHHAEFSSLVAQVVETLRRGPASAR